MKLLQTVFKHSGQSLLLNEKLSGLPKMYTFCRTALIRYIINKFDSFIGRNKIRSTYSGSGTRGCFNILPVFVYGEKTRREYKRIPKIS